MLRIGLTGGIGCGKSTVAAMMAELGCRIVYADKIAHQAIEPGQPAYDEVIAEFGREILADNQHIDRKLLASIVFADPARLARLNSIVHPRVLDAEDRQLQQLAREYPHGIAVVEAALLIEAGFHKRLDRLVVAWCKPEQQLARLTDASYGRSMSPEDAQRRIASQLSLDEKRRMADDVIDCSVSVEETRRQVVALVQSLQTLAAAR